MALYFPILSWFLFKYFFGFLYISIKSFLKENMYLSKNVLQKTNKGKKIIKFLFSHVRKNPRKFLKKENIKKNYIERSTSDFIAGMTDRFAINLYKVLR